MSMTLFSFGHPCEHQLRRTCIGGSSCPLNGYPDIWCCSYIKGKINFKRDKPCEGPRCRWGFTHPTQQQFDAVTQVLNESRPIAAKIDEAEDKELLTFHLDNPHIVDTVQCALHMMRHPPSSCAQRVGQLLAFAAVKSGEPRVLMQLLKTMKRPMDSYILGAYHYLTQGNPPAPTGSHGKESGAAGGGKNKKGGDKNGPKKEDVVEELKGDLVELMNAALSQGGHLVDRDDQHVLQATFIQALKQYPRSNKRRQEQLEAALAKFGNRQMPKEQPKTAAGTAAATTTATTAAPTATTPATATTTAAAGTEAKPTDSAAAPADAEPAAAKPAVSEAAPVSAPAPTSTASTTAATTPKSAAVTTPKLPPAGATTAAAPESALAATPKQPAATAATTAAAAAAAAATTPSAAAATPSAASQSSPAQPPPQTAAPPAAAQPLPPPPPPQQPVVGISRLVALRPATQTAAERMYEPIRTDLPLPDIFILGGLFNLSPNAANQAPLGLASVLAAPNTAAPSGPTAPAGSLLANSSNNSSAAHTNAFNVGTHVGPGGVNPPASHPNFNPKVSSSSSSSPQQAHYAHPGMLPHPAPHQQQHVQQPSLHHHQQQQQQQQGHHSHSHAGPGSMKYIPMPLSQQQQQQSAMMHALGHAGAGGVHNAGGNAHTAANLVAPQPQQQAPQLTIGAASNAFADSIFGNLSAEHIFDNLDTNQLFKDYEERWAS